MILHLALEMTLQVKSHCSYSGQLSIYCPSGPNPPFFALTHDAGAVPGEHSAGLISLTGTPSGHLSVYQPSLWHLNNLLCHTLGHPHTVSSERGSPPLHGDHPCRCFPSLGSLPQS